MWEESFVWHRNYLIEDNCTVALCHMSRCSWKNNLVPIVSEIILASYPGCVVWGLTIKLYQCLDLLIFIRPNWMRYLILLLPAIGWLIVTVNYCTRCCVMIHIEKYLYTCLSSDRCLFWLTVFPTTQKCDDKSLQCQARAEFLHIFSGFRKMFHLMVLPARDYTWLTNLALHGHNNCFTTQS